MKTAMLLAAVSLLPLAAESYPCNAQIPDSASYRSAMVDVRGVRLHTLDFGGSGLPVIFIHDWYEDAHTWTAMAPAFDDAHRVLAMTRRGYGQSDDVGWGYDVGTQAEDILGFMDALSIERAVLVGRHPTTQDMTWIAEHHPERLAGLVYLHHAIWPAPGDARMLRDRTLARMLLGYGGCWMGEEAYHRSAPRLLYRPHYFDDPGARIDVPAISFTHPQDVAAGVGELDLLDVVLQGATSADPGGAHCDAAIISESVAHLTSLANDQERLAAVRAMLPTKEERKAGADAFERAFGSNLRIVGLNGLPDYRTDPGPFLPHVRAFLEEVSAREADRGAGSASADTVQVASPAGNSGVDRASILAALNEVGPGGTIRFAAGTYMIGEIIHVTVPGITILGHPGGTTLHGCDPDVFSDSQVAVVACNGLDLAGGHQTVRDLTFEYAWHALVLGGMECFPSEGCQPVGEAIESRRGGYLVERNTFRRSQVPIRTLGQWLEPAVIRNNVFLDNFHAVGIHGSTVHVLDNQVSVSDPELVPGSRHPGEAMAISATDLRGRLALRCTGNVIAGNRIEGHPGGIGIMAFARQPVSCRDNVIRDNTIAITRVRVRGPASPVRLRAGADSTLIGVPIGLTGSPEGSTMPGAVHGVLEGTLIEGNRLSGAGGLGIEVFKASRNRIADNTIAGIARRDPFPGNTNPWADPERMGWREANGSGIWISPGSDDNEITGNTFRDVAAAAIVLEGSRNRVETRRAHDIVRDLGRGNRVSVQDTTQTPMIDLGGRAMRARISIPGNGSPGRHSSSRLVVSEGSNRGTRAFRLSRSFHRDRV